MLSQISAADHCFGVTNAFESLLQLISKSPRSKDQNKNQLILCTFSNSCKNNTINTTTCVNKTSRHSTKTMTTTTNASNACGATTKKPHDRLVSPLQLLGSVITATQRKYSNSKKLLKHSLSTQSAGDVRSNYEAIKAKNRSHSAPQFLISARRREQQQQQQHLNISNQQPSSAYIINNNNNNNTCSSHLTSQLASSY